MPEANLQSGFPRKGKPAPQPVRKKGDLTCVILRTLLGGLFLLAGILKAMEQPAFFAQLMEYQLFDAKTTWDLTWVILFGEILLGFWLLAAFATRVAALFGAFLLLLFSGILVSAWWRGLDIPCACLGPVELGGGYGVWFLRNLVLFAAFLWLAWRSPCLRSTIPRPQ